MPYVKRRTGTRRRPYVRRPRVRRTRRAGVRKAPLYRSRALASSGFPDRKIVKLKYCSTHSLPSSSGLYYGGHSYRTNSIFDPDYTGGGHQPYGFDQWAAVYGKYEVISSYMVVRYLASQSSQNAIVALLVTNDVDSSADLSTVRERPTTYSKVLTPQMPCKIARRWSFRKDSVNHAGWDNTASVAGNPNDSDYYRIFVSNVDGSTPLAQYSIAAIVEIVYTVKFWDRLLISGS